MYYTIKQINNIPRKYRTGKVLTDKLIPFNRELKLFDKAKPSQTACLQTSDNIQFIDLNPLMPVEITDTEWNNWNEPDIIKYKSASGVVYIVQDEKLLTNISEFLQENGNKGKLSYLHIKGKEGWECYRTPAEIHILEYLWAYHYNYDIYTVDGELVQEENKEKRRIDLPEIVESSGYK